MVKVYIQRLVRRLYEFLWNSGIELKTPSEFAMFKGFDGRWTAVTVIFYKDDFDYDFDID